MGAPRVPCSGSAPDLPVYASGGAAGADVRAHLASPLVIPPGDRALVPTGLHLQVPPGYEAQVRPRSGLAAAKGVTVLNAPGTIDSDYRGEVKVLLVNLGRDPVTISPGDRIAQLVFAAVVRVEFLRVEKLDETSRGGGGFGSTGA